MSSTPVDRFRLHRAGVLNIWQYDQQVFEFAGGRMLLRGANGAGKSKTLEMLLPFVLDGDKNRMTASGKHHTSLMWLMTDGYDGQSRTGYLWVEFRRESPDGPPDGPAETVTCGVGVRASASARTATCWYFTTGRRIGADLLLEDDTGPLTRERCREAIGPDGHFFDSARPYKEHVGRTLFGLGVDRFEDLLRLLYWLRQPQVGEDIEPGRLAAILSVALPEMDEASLRSAGDTFDELAAFGEQLERRQRAADALTAFAQVYASYARTVARSRGAALIEADREQRQRVAEVARAQRAVAEIAQATATAEAAAEAAERGRTVAEARWQQLQASPEAQSQTRLLELRRAAHEAEDRAKRAERQVDRDRQRTAATGDRLATWATDITAVLRQFGDQVHDSLVTGRRAGLVLDLVVPARLAAPVMAEAADADLLATAIEDFAGSLDQALPAIGARLAAVSTVEHARLEFAGAEQAAAETGRIAAGSERQAEQAHGRRTDAQAATAAEEATFLDRLAAWRTAPAALDFPVPDEWDSAAVSGLPARARRAAEPRLDALRDRETTAAAGRVTAEQESRRLQGERAGIEAEREPAPAPPALGRSPRDQLPGAPLWRLVDFAGSGPAEEHAGLEAALESAGLLDAWVQPDGAVLDADRLDVVLPAGPAVRAPALGTVLVPAVPDGAGVPAAVVGAVLDRIALVAPGGAPSGGAGSDAGAAPGPAAVSPDGRWWLGPLTGRAAKPAAQYVGAGARAAERLRRLVEIDARLAEVEARGAEASAAELAARSAIAAIDSWLAAFPPYAELVAGWARLQAALEEAARADAHARQAQQAAEAARSVAAARRAELHRLAQSFELPVDADGLAARRTELTDLQHQLKACGQRASGQQPALKAWQGARRDHDGDLTGLAELVAQAGDQRRQAAAARAASDTEQEKVGASVQELQVKLELTGREIETCKRQAAALGQELRAISERRGAATSRLETAQARREEYDPVVVERARSLAGLAQVPGLLAACDLPEAPAPPASPEPSQHEPETSDQAAAIEAARGAQVGHRLAAELTRFAAALAGLEVDRPTEDTAVWRGHQELAAGPAAECEPRILPVAEALAALARDDAGEHAVGVLAARLTAQVARDKELLTERERRLFEDHILGDLGETLRSRRTEAAELVAAMNKLLAGISTSQGIRVSLDWRLRADVGEDARRAVTLLGTPVGALLPEERRELRDALHRLIETSRAEEPELSYTEHLVRCLDYRQWFAFRIRYTRPETPGTWLELHRRSPLSQGEQKVVCYLPLFAAAAAHFTSVAGAAPHAPRFVLLDDAFPKIDVRTHPLLFGLLVDLDLDFVITSERLWGDHATVPALAIYEALRDPAQRGIAQYRHTWDGVQLHAVGA